MTPETYLEWRRARAAAAEENFPCPCGGAVNETACPIVEDSPCEAYEEPRPKVTCCCKASMVEALRLLCGESVSSLVDFESFFFLTDSLAVGSALSAPGTDTDNIEDPDASLRRFSPCNCDLLDVGGAAYFAAPGGSVALSDVEQLSLCAIKAVAFQLLEDEEPEEGCCRETNYHKATWAIRRAIRAEGGNTSACGRCAAHCDCDDCCCAAGIVQELSSRNLSRQVTLTAGPLVLQNVAVLGSVGSVLVLGDEDLRRFYLVCANAVEAIG